MIGQAIVASAWTLTCRPPWLSGTNFPQGLWPTQKQGSKSRQFRHGKIKLVKHPVTQPVLVFCYAVA